MSAPSATEQTVTPRQRSRPEPGRVSAALRLLDRPLTSYYLVLGITMLLLALGLVDRKSVV